jgi:hypothetical protein
MTDNGGDARATPCGAVIRPRVLRVGAMTRFGREKQRYAFTRS